jgi:hypothetical protein
MPLPAQQQTAAFLSLEDSDGMERIQDWCRSLTCSKYKMTYLCRHNASSEEQLEGKVKPIRLPTTNIMLLKVTGGLPVQGLYHDGKPGC